MSEDVNTGSIDPNVVDIGHIDDKPKLTETEQRAVGLGWSPKEEWTGDPDGWRPAREWLDRGELLGEIRRLNGNVAQTQAQVAEAFKTGQRMSNEALKKEIDELREVRRNAQEEGDFKTAEKIENQIDTLKDRARTAQAPQAPQNFQIPPEHVLFEQRNPWYNQDPVKRYTADALGHEFMRVNQGRASAGDMYKFVEDKMKETGRNRDSPPVETGGNNLTKQSGNVGGASLSSIEAGMTAEQKDIMKTLLKTKVFDSKEEYLKAFK